MNREDQAQASPGILRRVGLAGLTIGAALGGSFGLAVASFADCVGPHCMCQRAVGVLAHAAGVGVAGFTGSLLVHTLVRLLQQLRNRPG